MGKRGGARAGAGRKPKHEGERRVSLSTRVSPRGSESLRAYAERTGKSLGEALDEMLAAALAQAPFADLQADLEDANAPASAIAKVEDAASAYDQLARHVEQSVEELRSVDGRLQAQAVTLAEQEALIRVLIDHLPVAMAYLDGDLIYRLINRTWAAGLGGTPEQYIGRRFDEVAPTRTRELAALREVQTSGVPHREYGLAYELRADGEARTAYWDFTTVAVATIIGSKPGLLTVATDVTDRVRFEQEQQRWAAELETQRVLLENILRYSPAGILYLDRGGVVRWVNPAFLRTRRRTEPDYLNRPLFEAAPEARPLIEPLMREVLATGTPREVKGYRGVELAEGHSHERSWDLGLHPVFDDTREIVGLLLFLQGEQAAE